MMILTRQALSCMVMYNGQVTRTILASAPCKALPQMSAVSMMHSSHASQTQTQPTQQEKKYNQEFERHIQENVDKIKEGKSGGTVSHPDQLQHFKIRRAQLANIRCVDGTHQDEPPIGTHSLPHPIWDEKDMHDVKITHKPAMKIHEKLAYNCVKVMRAAFDWLSGYKKEPRTEAMWINRICFLETVAGVPGMVAAMVRHLNSLRLMRRDHGWIHTLLEEAENERMHLMTALQLKQPTFLFRAGVMGTQAVFVGGFSIAYLISPKFCHRFVGYLEEEAVMTYSKLIKDMEKGGPMHHWTKQPAPDLAVSYWQLPSTATMYDVMLAIRADEAHHRVVNHTMASMKKDDYNPYKPGE